MSNFYTFNAKGRGPARNRIIIFLAPVSATNFALAWLTENMKMMNIIQM